MSKLDRLLYKTRGNVDPQGRPRVYFCSHPADFPRYFESISEEILSINNTAAIWYYNPDEERPSEEMMLDSLSQMQLFVVPVTSEFVFMQSDARTIEFRYAVEHNIPVLPLIQEENIADAFNKVCGDMQCIGRFSDFNSYISLPYEEKLKKYIQDILVGDELAEKIRNAFDAHVFLSYRRKDRKYAQQIKHIVHKNAMLRDVAVWSDEFIMPGEQFNDVIRKSLEDCDLFALTVTPGILEGDNYVKTKEYPLARDRGKVIVPIEAEATDMEELENCYRNITEPVPLSDEDRLTGKIADALKSFALLGNSSDPQHLFFIGLAYLSGIDVEVNHDMARSLITEAAENKLPEAHRQLVAMYNCGNGVERDYAKAVEWQEKYVDLLASLNENYISELDSLCSMQNNIGDIAEAKNSAERLVEYAKQVNDTAESEDSLRNLSKSLDRRGRVFEDAGDLKTAVESYEESLAISERIADISKLHKDMLKLSVSYERLGDISKLQGNIANAKDNFIKSLKIRESTLNDRKTNDLLEALAIVYRKIGGIFEVTKDIKNAKGYYDKALDIRKQIAEQAETPESSRGLAICYEDICRMSEASNDFQIAREMCLRSLNIFEKLADTTGKMQFRRDRTRIYLMAGDLCGKCNDKNKAKEYYRKSVSLSEQLAANMKTLEIETNLAAGYTRMGDILQDEGNLSKANELYARALRIYERLAEATGTYKSLINLSVTYVKIGDIHNLSGDAGDAEKKYQQALEICEKIAGNPKLTAPDKELFVIYLKLTLFYKNNGNIMEALKYSRKANEVRKRIDVKKEFNL